ncbi:unnamed protein product [Phytophthora fragariaefolia]|uniref:Unnamed protein product n=1 Tax=Phytophthora fragariaefolia TaxID=1490495 RepID=A0A9W6UFI6_9STRA|nr:unnamed protein product [Phytophthora fragariaefolia]
MKSRELLMIAKLGVVDSPLLGSRVRFTWLVGSFMLEVGSDKQDTLCNVAFSSHYHDEGKFGPGLFNQALIGETDTDALPCRLVRYFALPVVQGSTSKYMVIAS